MRTAETAFDMLRISKIAAKNPVTHFMSYPGSSKRICVMRDVATIVVQVHGFLWACIQRDCSVSVVTSESKKAWASEARNRGRIPSFKVFRKDNFT